MDEMYRHLKLLGKLGIYTVMDLDYAARNGRFNNRVLLPEERQYLKGYIRRRS